jgi:acyl carrier protein
MTETEILATIRNIASTELAIPADLITAEAVIGDFDVDSLDVIKLAIHLEKRFSIVITPGEVAAATTIADIVDRIKAKRAA